MLNASDLGARLHRLRKDRRLTLQQLADRSGVSRAAISKVERGESGASTTVVGKLAEALDISISQLIGGSDGDAVVHIPRVKQPVYREESSGFERRSLSPLYLGRGVDFVLNRLPAGARTGPFPSHRDGVEEHLYVTRGTLIISLDGEEYELSEGDFLFYEGNRNHSFANPADEDCEYFIVIDSTRLR